MRVPGDYRSALLVTQLAFAVLLIGEVVQLVESRSHISLLLDQQATADVSFKRLDTQLDALARGTQRLARDGNADAVAIVDRLAQQGIHINGGAPKG